MMAQFVKLVEVLAWPVVALVMFLLSRNYIDGLVGRVMRVKVHDVEVELREKIVSLAAGADLLAKKPPHAHETGHLVTEILNRAEIDRVERQPVAAIMNKWQELENALYRRATGKKGREWKGTLSAVDHLVSDKVMTEEEVKLFNRLYEIRNIIAHEVGDLPLSAGYAFEFFRTANLLIEKLEPASK